jgi:hypothetical protein
MIVRISMGRFELERVAEIERLMAAGEEAVRAPLPELPGLGRYYVGNDRDLGEGHQHERVGHDRACPGDERAATDARAAPDPRGRRGRVRDDHEPRGVVVARSMSALMSMPRPRAT